jgi:hypothetical protein
MLQVLKVYNMTEYAQGSQLPREAINNAEQHLSPNDKVDEVRDELLGKDGVFFDQFGEVEETRGYRLSASHTCTHVGAYQLQE